MFAHLKTGSRPNYYETISIAIHISPPVFQILSFKYLKLEASQYQIAIGEIINEKALRRIYAWRAFCNIYYDLQPEVSGTL